MQTMTNKEVLALIENGAEQNVHETRILSKFAIGQHYRQGDILVHRVPDNHPRGKKLGHRKLAIGQGVGSNHFAEGHIELYEGTTLPATCDAGTFLGPVIVAPKGFLNTHPKHADCQVEVGGVYQVTHQVNVRTRERARD